MPSHTILLGLLVLVGVCLVALQAASLLFLRDLLRRTTRGNRRRSRQLRRLSKASRKQGDQIQEGRQEILAQVEALIDLYALVTPRASMPSTQGWAAAPTTMQALVRTVIERSPSVVVECGSGSSSVWLGYVLQRFHGRCVSLEHDPEYAEATRALLRTHGLEDVVDVRLAPLRAVRIGEQTFSWYDPDALADLRDVGVVFVDGPPGAVGPLARFPALPLLRDHCAPGAVFLLDDTTRSDETAIERRWIEQYGGIPAGRGTAGTGWRAIELGAAAPRTVASRRALTPSDPAPKARTA